MTELKQGSSGSSVKEWQEFLLKAGYATEVDGNFGVNTKEATISFQRDNGLTPDGILGSNTLAKARELQNKDTSRDLPNQNIKGIGPKTKIALAAAALIAAYLFLNRKKRRIGYNERKYGKK